MLCSEQHEGLGNVPENENELNKAAASKDTKQSKKKKKDKKAIAKAPSGPSNAAEAEKIRDIMGELSNRDACCVMLPCHKRRSSSWELLGFPCRRFLYQLNSVQTKVEQCPYYEGIRKGKTEAPKQGSGFSFGFQADAKEVGNASDSEEEEQAQESEEESAALPLSNGHAKKDAQPVQVPER